MPPVSASPARRAAGRSQPGSRVESRLLAGSAVTPGARRSTEATPEATRTVRPPESAVAARSRVCWRGVSRSGTATRRVVSGPAASAASSRVVTTRVSTPRSASSSATARLPEGSAERGSRWPCRASERTTAMTTAATTSSTSARATPRERVHTWRAVGEAEVAGEVTSVVIRRLPGGCRCPCRGRRRGRAWCAPGPPSPAEAPPQGGDDGERGDDDDDQAERAAGCRRGRGAEQVADPVPEGVQRTLEPAGVVLVVHLLRQLPPGRLPRGVAREGDGRFVVAAREQAYGGAGGRGQGRYGLENSPRDGHRISSGRCRRRPGRPRRAPVRGRGPRGGCAGRCRGAR